MPHIYASTLKFLGDSWILSFDPRPHPKWALPCLESANDPPCPEHHSPQTLAPLLDRLDIGDPAAFVFHIGRCGSTWLGRLLDLHPHARVLFEPRYLCNLAAASHGWSGELDRLGNLAEPLVRLAGAGCPVGVRPIIKWPSHAIALAPLLKQRFPRVPQVVVVRDPLEVLAALEQDPPNFLATSTSWVRTVLAGYEETEDVATRCGHYLEWLLRQVRSGLRNFDLVVDYEELPEATSAVLKAVGFSGELAPEELAAASAKHSKTLDSGFSSDSDLKRSCASDSARRLAERLRTTLYLPCRQHARNGQ
jgi:hypothetical protein